MKPVRPSSLQWQLKTLPLILLGGLVYYRRYR